MPVRWIWQTLLCLLAAKYAVYFEARGMKQWQEPLGKYSVINTEWVCMFVQMQNGVFILTVKIILNCWGITKETPHAQTCMEHLCKQCITDRLQFVYLKTECLRAQGRYLNHKYSFWVGSFLILQKLAKLLVEQLFISKFKKTTV